LNWRIGRLSKPDLAQPLREALGQQVGQHAAQFGGRARAAAAQRGAGATGQQVEQQRLAGLPVGGDLQDRRAADAAVGDQQHVAKRWPAQLAVTGSATPLRSCSAPGACR
jgi:hypothetical protein